ncbi:MAG: transcription elongation factor GreA [Clostridia bacterium]|nr:transcription elongation factor GreA [Clostridia bacterium]
MAEVFLTEKGFQELEEKLNYLKTVRRAEVTEKIKTAREFGDISENAEYDAAKDEQASVEGEILEIETKLRSAKIIEDIKDLSVVTIGCKVVLFNYNTNKEESFQIVGSTESNPYESRISNESPVGKAVLGKNIGDAITVNAPAGDITMKLLSIHKM